MADIATLDTAQCALRLRRSVAQLWRKLRPGLQRDGMSLAKLGVLGQLHRASPLSPSALAAREGVKVQTLTRVLAELEGDGWVRRSTDALDRRQSMLSLSAKGRRGLLEAAKTGDAAFARLLAAQLSSEERELLMQACELLDRLADAMASASA